MRDAELSTIWGCRDEFGSDSSYIDLINKTITLCSSLVPLIALLLRRIGFGISKTPPEQRSGIEEFLAMIFFGGFGAALGFFLFLVCSILLAMIIGLQLFQSQANGATLQLQLPDLHLTAVPLVASCLSILTTLLAFGGKNRLRGLAFVGGCCFGGGIGIMVVMSWILH